ncbi:carboxylate-amine ligase [Nocardioides cynanchi]|uniref:carboxylate-amine ligase n=1 Tax=Nocardioides cynanchi TaxID=2558918 RepID=UPI0012442C9D|nr:YbdK family carboxylate-amine ligase [Nocardioides cynanchi]
MDTVITTPVAQDLRPLSPSDVTVGVEEEFALLAPGTGRVVCRAPDVVRDCSDAAGIVPECMSYMIETRTPVCHTLREVAQSLRTHRHHVAAVARGHGALMVASGVAPFGVPSPPAITRDPRYIELVQRFPLAMSTAGTCGCHVHVAVPNRQLGVEVLLRIRRWLPALIALTANSPVWRGHDTRWASRRMVFISRWPTAAPAPPVESAEAYDELLRSTVSSGRALDARSIYFLARLSPRYPTVEVRLADVSLSVDEAACYAGLVRALVATALDEEAHGHPAAWVPQARLRESCRLAALSGLSGSTTDPLTDERLEPWEFIDRMLEQVQTQLRAHGDDVTVVSTLDRLRLAGGGAERQRRLFGSTVSPALFVQALAERSISGLEA